MRQRYQASMPEQRLTLYDMIICLAGGKPKSQKDSLPGTVVICAADGTSEIRYSTRSKIPAAPIPPPMHMVTMP